MIWQLYPMALDCGIRPAEFWAYSLGEIRDLLESRVRTERLRVKECIAGRYKLADLIGLYIQIPYDKDKVIQIPNPWDQYPDLFWQERKRYEQSHQVEMVEKARTSRREYAQRYNDMRKKRGLA